MREIKFRLIWERPKSYASGGYQLDDPKVLFSYITLDDLINTIDWRKSDGKTIFPVIPKEANSRLKIISYSFMILVATDEYTGLKDKNGKEAYESDLFLNPDDSFGRVYRILWADGGFWFEPLPEGSVRQFGSHATQENIGKCTIIGNELEGANESNQV